MSTEMRVQLGDSFFPDRYGGCLTTEALACVTATTLSSVRGGNRVEHEAEGVVASESDADWDGCVSLGDLSFLTRHGL